MTEQHTASDRHFGGSETGDAPVGRDELRAEVQAKYPAAPDAVAPGAEFHFHTGRFIAERCGYDMAVVDTLPTEAVESFAGVANPFALRDLQPGERVVDLGSGAGFGCFVAATAVGDSGRVIGVDMTPAMLTKSRSLAAAMGTANVEFRDGYLEELPVEDGWADVVISNGNPVPQEAQRHIDLWTG